MYDPFGKSPQFGSTDWAARKIRALLDEEDRRRAAPARAAAQTAENAAASPLIPPRKPVQAAAPAYPLPPVKPEQTPAWRQDERANRIIDEIIDKWEQGRFDDPVAGHTNFGVAEKTLQAWRASHGGQTMPSDPYQLTRDQAARILKENYYDWYGLADLQNERLAHQLMDSYTMSSPAGVSEFVQQALDDVMRRHGLYTPQRDNFEPTDPVGPRTRRRLNWLVESGYGQELKNAIAKRRQAYVETLSNYKDNPGWPPRIRRFIERPHGH